MTTPTYRSDQIAAEAAGQICRKRNDLVFSEVEAIILSAIEKSTLELAHELKATTTQLATERQSRRPTATDDQQVENLARDLHDIYERLAPDFDYETRKETREFDPQSPNGRLMIAVCRELQFRALRSTPTAHASDSNDYVRVHGYKRPAARASEPGIKNCDLCDKGFPINASGYHYGTQRLGMIPNTPCKLRNEAHASEQGEHTDQIAADLWEELPLDRNRKEKDLATILSAIEKSTGPLHKTIAILRRDLANPPPDVQEKVIQMLDLVSRDAQPKPSEVAVDYTRGSIKHDQGNASMQPPAKRTKSRNCICDNDNGLHWGKCPLNQDAPRGEQEWTPEYVRQLGGFARISYEHNAALAAEREKNAKTN